MKRFSQSSFRWTLAALMLVLMLALPWAALASSVDVAVVDVTIPTGSVTLAPGESGPITINMTVTGKQDGTATFKVYRDWTLSGGVFTGSNPQTFTVNPRTAQDAPTTFSTSGAVSVAAGQSAGTFTLAVSAFDITNSNQTGSKLGDGADSNYQVTVSPPADTTPPVIVPTVSPAPNVNGWNNADVTVSWSVSDPESGIASSSGCGTTTLTTETVGTTLTCSATNGVGLSNSASVTVKIDKTAPTASASASPGPNANGWNNTNVVVSFSGSDALSGIASCDAPVTLSAEGAGQSASGTCTDKAGNVSAPATASGINIDKTPPTFGACPTGGPFLLNSGSQSVGPIAVDAAISGLDAGLSTLSGSVDTSSVGTKTVTFTAVDNAGNSATKSCGYSVIYKWDGFFRPVDNLPVLNVAKAGSAIPVKFSLSGNQGLNIFASGTPSYPRSVVIACDSMAPADGIEETVTAGGSSLNYDASADQYIYVWKTDKAWAGTCRQLVVMLNDGMAYRANFKWSK